MINTNLNLSRYMTHLMIIFIRRDSPEPIYNPYSHFLKGKGLGTSRYRFPWSTTPSCCTRHEVLASRPTAVQASNVLRTGLESLAAAYVRLWFAGMEATSDPRRSQDG